MTSLASARALTLALAFCAAASPDAAAQLAVVSTSPAINAGGVPRNASISVTFDRAVDPATFTAPNFRAFGKWSGAAAGTLTYSNLNRTVTLAPTRPFMAGEQVMLIMSRNLRGADTVALRSAGYTLPFMTAVTPSQGIFREAQRLFTRGPNGVGPQTRIYGGQASDLNGDGWADLTIINEVSADIRVFMNLTNGQGMSSTYLAPRAIPFESSPNEPGDFNGDGRIDIVTSSNALNQVAIARGNGDGTFQVPTLITLLGYPRSFGIIDADGDGDLDIFCACADGDVIARLLNDGAGNFSAPVGFEGGVGDEYAMCAADMNADGIMDLVVGGTSSNSVNVMRGNGDGTFTSVPGSSRPCGGPPWVIACADLDGDGDIDVSTGNSFAANGAILFNTGGGALSAASIKGTAGHTVATDLVDFEGDGDMDWVLSSFGGGTWHTYLNQAVPDERSIEESVCERCGHGYSACIESGDTLCCECKTEDIMHRASELENQGVAMGAGSVDRISQRMIYGFREPALATMRW